MNFISRKDVLRTMRAKDKKGNPVPFSLSVCTFNRKTGVGGLLLEVESAMIFEKKSSLVSDATGSSTATAKRNIHHDLNETKNILLLPSREIRTIHIRLIEKFNTKIVFD
jgi:hypothetical protein